MIVDYDRKFIFVHIPKTGGTSITRVLEPFVENGVASPDVDHKHWTVWKIVRKLFDSDLGKVNGWTIAAVARNPWDMIHSDYQFCMSYAPNLEQMEARRGGEWVEKIRRTSEQTFKAFVHENYLSHPYGIWESYCWEWATTNEIVNCVLQFNHLNSDFLSMCKLVGYELTCANLPVVNATKERTDYILDFRKWPNLADKVGEKFKYVIDRFEYKFEEGIPYAGH